VPKAGDLDLSGLDIAHEKVDEATHIDLDEWEKELESIGEFFGTLGPSLPRVLELHREALIERMKIIREAKKRS
jgi:phosphoenolpyruvate carboxykinase (GTP)